MSAFEDWYLATFDEDETPGQTMGGQKSQKTLQQSMKPEEMGENGEEQEGKDIDPDAVAFIKAKRKVDDLHKAKRHEKKA